MNKLYLLTTMAQYPAAYAAELSGLPPELYRWKPSEREWSLAEVIAHLADAEEIYLQDRLMRILTENRPAIAGFDQDQYAVERRYNQQDPLQNLARFAAANAGIVSLAWTTPEDGGWDRVGVHSEAGELSFREMLRRLAGHHHSHLNQMRRIKLHAMR